MPLHLIIFILLLPLFCLQAQDGKDTLRFRVMSYNVENLFDYRHDSLKNDHEFLPEATRHWNYRKYRKKLDDVARVIMAVGEWKLPALVALCEVENDTVLQALTRYSALREADYRYIMTDSPDERGIDVALLYQRHLFKPLTRQSISIRPPKKHSRPTRDILHVSGLLLNLDTLDVLVCYFPSRSGGAKESEPYRLQAARQVRNTVDSLFRTRLRAQILVMGDFNDYPRNKSIREVLCARIPPEQHLPDERTLYHLLARKAAADRHFGTYKYQGEWGLLDHILVSGSLLRPDAPCCTGEADAHVFRPPFLLTEDTKHGGVQPFRTYNGPRYLGGYSDHLPVWAEFRLIY